MNKGQLIPVVRSQSKFTSAFLFAFRLCFRGCLAKLVLSHSSCSVRLSSGTNIVGVLSRFTFALSHVIPSRSPSAT